MSRLLLWYHESEWSNQAPKKGVTTVLNNQIIWQCKDTISFTLVHKKTCLFKNWILHVKTICVAACLNVLNWKQTWMSFWAIAEENMYSTKKFIFICSLQISLPCVELQIEEVKTLRDPFAILKCLASQSPTGEVTLNLCWSIGATNNKPLR